MKWKLRSRRSGEGSSRKNRDRQGSGVSSQDDRPMLKDKVAQGVAKSILRIQSGFAKFMSQRTAKISSSGLKACLAIFFLSGSSFSIYIVVSAFTKRSSSKAIHIDRLSVPKYYNNESDERSLQITKQEFEEVQLFKKYMDSLSQSNSGRHEYDSIIKVRPGLMDSVKELEKIYLNQK